MARVDAAWRAELRAIMVLALPVVIQTTAQQGMTVVDQIFLGHLGTAQLGAAALANAFTNLLWFFLLGFATALDTLGSNAFGAGDRGALITWCVAAALLVTVLVLPVALGMAAGEWVGGALFAQDAYTSRLMGEFCEGLIFGIWPLMWGIILTKYLQVQNIMILPSIIAVATFCLNIGFNAVLVSSMGFRGAPLATSLSRCAGCFDIATVMAGRLGAVNIAAHAAMLSVCTLTYLACPFALATAGAIRVGNLLPPL
ncbi:putative transporter C11D3.06 [Tetrabaena socialis]|uniref:Putative transporter C11D3.06 n=1 Tax=Tetrabaena socialis TaxID=47790 RepID=A0A2J7ZRJ7_9CHLO|nr:putative transporter C11D3.06 [Tetrabaena socialis]|eukprot:PNH02895.1 putative transporter C11D3.06 [Tetrabaena socialis]